MKQSTYCYPLCASENLQIEDSGEEVIVFDSKNKKFHFLNATAHNILKACNGNNSISDIAAQFSAKFYPDGPHSVIDDVAEVISTFQTQGLIMFVADEVTPPQTSASSTSDSPLLAISVTGTSMFPTLFSGDRVLVKKTTPEELSAGDIIVWTADSNERVAHRIVSIALSSNPPVIITKGDLLISADPPIAFDRVIGVVVAVLRDGKVSWISELNAGNHSPQETASPQKQRPSYTNMQVLDLRDISVESIRNIGSVEQIGLVLLSPENAHAWADVTARKVGRVVTAPRQYRVYTGQPELLPDMLEFMEKPLRLIVSGQLFLTGFEPEQITEAFEQLILVGQAYVSSEESKAALQSLTNIVSGEISVIPVEHTRWIGQSILGPEYLNNSHRPLVVVGDLATSKRMENIPDNISLFR